MVGGVDAFRRRVRARMREGEPRVRDGARRRREEDERERRAARDARARPGFVSPQDSPARLVQAQTGPPAAKH